MGEITNTLQAIRQAADSRATPGKPLAEPGPFGHVFVYCPQHGVTVAEFG
jgi:hypothetical protein